MNFDEWLTWITVYIPQIITAASIITALTPTPKDDELLARLRRLLNVLALNVGKAAPKDS